MTTTDGRRKKLRAKRFGRLGENIATVTLWLTGWRVLARGFRGGGGEIDLIAARRGVLAIIEVKARRDLDSALHALGPAQRQRIIGATRAFLTAHPELDGHDIRFDVIAVSPGRLPKRIAGAFRTDGL